MNLKSDSVGDVPRSEASGAPAPALKHPAHIPSLDGLRAVFFMVVFIDHVGMMLGIGHLLPASFGVTCFFFLSGYLITTLLRKEVEKSGRINLRNFFIRRALRILPPLYLTLAFALVLEYAGIQTSARASIGSFLSQLFHYSNYYLIYFTWDALCRGTTPMWSISVEEHFYFIMPLVYIGLRKLCPQPHKLVTCFYATCLALCLWRLVLICGLHVTEDRCYVASDTRFDSLLFGSALAIFGNPWLDPTRIAEQTWKWILFPLSCLVIIFSFWFHHRVNFIPTVWVLVPADWFKEGLRYSLQGIALIPIFVCAVRYPSWLGFSFLNTRPMIFLGGLSYTLYLSHEVMIQLFINRFHLTGIVLAMVSFAATLAWSLAMYYVVETRCARISAGFRN